MPLSPIMNEINCAVGSISSECRKRNRGETCTWTFKLLLHGHKHKTFVSQVNYPKRRDANINSECMHCVAVVGMGSTGASGVQNKFATIRFERDDVLIDFYNIYSDESSEGHLCQSMRLSLK